MNPGTTTFEVHPPVYGRPRASAAAEAVWSGRAVKATPRFVGLAACVGAIASFRSIPKVFCLGPGALTVTRPYRWSRNPQYVGFVALLGIAACWWTWPCLVALGMMAVAIHALVLVEEEHLNRVFGDAYGQFRRRTPRYLGWARL